MPNIWHLTHQTPKTNPHQIFQISKILAWSYSTLSNMRAQGRKCQKFIFLFYLLFLSPPNTYLSLSLSLSLSLFLFHSSPISPKTTTWHCWSLCQDRIPRHTTLLSSYTIHHATPRNNTPRHATPRRRAIGTSHHRISLNRPAMVGFAFGFVWFVMGFEVCGCGGLWVTCGSGTVVVVAIGGYGGDYWVIVVVICWVVMDFFFFKVVLVDVGLCRWWLSVLLRLWWLWDSLIWDGFWDLWMWWIVVDFFFLVVDFFFVLRWRWWMCVCAGGGRRCCCGSGCWWSLLL